MTVLLDPANPHDISREELEELAAELRSQLPGVSVEPAPRPEEGFGGPWAEVLYVWHEGKEAAETAVLVGTAVKWMKRRWARDHEKHPDKPRPRSVVEVADDEVVRDVKIDLPKGEAVDQEITDKRPPHGKPTPEDGS